VATYGELHIVFRNGRDRRYVHSAFYCVFDSGALHATCVSGLISYCAGIGNRHENSNAFPNLRFRCRNVLIFEA
jgi:hypothetical protein